MSAFITTADSPKALAVVRSLGRAGVPVATGAARSPALAAFSRYSRHFFPYPSPSGSPSDFIASLARILGTGGYDAVIPVHSEDTYLVARHRDLLGKRCAVPLHDYQTLVDVNDKAFLMRAAGEAGFPVPVTYQPTDPGDLARVAEKVTYPAVIKLRESRGSIGVSYAGGKDELVAKFYDTVEKFGLTPGHYPLVQEYVPGEGYGVSALFNHGDLRAIFCHKRIREYPLSGGPSTCRVSVRMPGMERIATDLLGHFDWHGVAMVEFKQAPGGRPVVLEINPRFWGSINQAILSGVDFPSLLYTMAVEGDCRQVLGYRTGVVTRNVFADIAALAAMVRRHRSIRQSGDLLSWPLNDDILSLDDPLPLLGFLPAGMRALFSSSQNP